MSKQGNQQNHKDRFRSMIRERLDNNEDQVDERRRANPDAVAQQQAQEEIDMLYEKLDMLESYIEDLNAAQINNEDLETIRYIKQDIIKYIRQIRNIQTF